MPIKPRTSSSPLPLSGTVLAFNVSPRGYIEGALVKTLNGAEQVNFPRHMADILARSVRVGSKVDLNVVALETEEGVHCVHRLCDQEGEASGKVVRLNYALHGELNGYHLDDATFLHMKPKEARKYNLRLGDQVKATGARRAGPDAVVLDVRILERVERLGKRHDDAPV